jgi:stage II sporulation protein D
MFYRTVLIIFVFIFILSGCSGSERFTGNDKSENVKEIKKHKGEFFKSNILNPVRVLIQNSSNKLEYKVDEPLNLFDTQNKIALIKTGNKINFFEDDGYVLMKINEKEFSSEYFELQPADSSNVVSFNKKNYRGKLRVLNSDGEIKIINIIDLEDYLKGVIPSEMPIGKDDKNLEALKAFAICARTYSLMKMNKNQNDFDLYIDVRDQVYGGADNEKPLSNKAVDETKGVILFFNNEPAVTFYHSTCGGETENSKNIFTQDEIPYLSGVDDNEPPYCSISPRFTWKEVYERKEFLKRFVAAGIIQNNNSELENIEIKSRFSSGRVNELVITVVENEQVKQKYSVFGNNIRTIIRTSDNKSILFSTMFEIFLDGNNVIIDGRGYGHGVGMCQYGAIGQSHLGIKYLDILYHYFPGTIAKKYDE